MVEAIIPRPILAYSRETGEPLALVPSSSVPNAFHVTTLTRCDCRGFQFRGKCRHLATVQAERGIQDGAAAHLAVKRAAGEWPTVPAHVAEMAATYHSIFGGQE